MKNNKTIFDDKLLFFIIRLEILIAPLVSIKRSYVFGIFRPYHTAISITFLAEFESLDPGIFCTVWTLADYYQRKDHDLAAAYEIDRIRQIFWKLKIALSLPLFPLKLITWSLKLIQNFSKLSCKVNCRNKMNWNHYGFVNCIRLQ